MALPCCSNDRDPPGAQRRDVPQRDGQIAQKGSHVGIGNPGREVHPVDQQVHRLRRMVLGGRSFEA